MMLLRLVSALVVPACLVAVACNGSTGDDASAAQAAVINQSCRQEMNLLCPEGQFDGCDVPGLTNQHVCVANEDRDGSASCRQEMMARCASGLKDACMLDPAPSDQHICVATREAACCDQAKKPPSGLEGAHCCADGSWQSDIGDGDEERACRGAGGVGRVCESQPKCCDPATKPSGGIEGAHCCADGSWQYDPGNGSSCSRSGGSGQVCTP
jgi:hypothetical protein